MYIRSSVKLLINCTTRYKSLLSTNPKAFTNTLLRMLDDMEAVITNSKHNAFYIPCIIPNDKVSNENSNTF